MVVYLIHNTVNGKYYVGKTVSSVSKRWNQHLTDSRLGRQTRMPLHSAIRKYGEDAFSVHPLVSTLGSDEELKYWEQFFISLFKANDRRYGYNVTPGGDGAMSGRHHSDETKRKMSAAKRGRVCPPTSEETKRKLRNIAISRGFGFTPADTAKAIASTKGRKPWNYGKTLSVEYKQQIRETKLKQVAELRDNNPAEYERVFNSHHKSN